MNTIEYQAYLYNYTTEEFQLPQRKQTGYIIMSSNMVFYYDQWLVNKASSLKQENHNFYVFGNDETHTMMIIILTLLVLLTLSLIAIYCIIRSKSAYTSLIPSTTEEAINHTNSEFTVSGNQQHNPLSLQTIHTHTAVSDKLNNNIYKQLKGDCESRRPLISNLDLN